MKSVEGLLEIMRRLRDPEGGCPWDIVQDFKSIAPYTIEEAYEVADAIHQGDMAELKGELGDLLFNVIYHAQMAEEAGAFNFDDVAQAIGEKMIRRHPHVFADAPSVADEAAQTDNWERIKAAERADKASAPQSALEGVPLALPALTRAEKLQKRAARVGFDWADTDAVLEKVVEEAHELRDEMESDADRAALVEEYGDLLATMVNLGRHLQLDPEEALRSANRKFERRFKGVEAHLAAKGQQIAAVSLEEAEAAWQAVKRAEKAR